MTDHPSAALDDVIHQRVRLGILSILTQAREADFTYLRNTLGVTDGNLARHLEVLNEAGFVAINKTFEGRRPRTWITITAPGRRALAHHIKALRALIDTIDPPHDSNPAPEAGGALETHAPHHDLSGATVTPRQPPAGHRGSGRPGRARRPRRHSQPVPSIAAVRQATGPPGP